MKKIFCRKIFYVLMALLFQTVTASATPNVGGICQVTTIGSLNFGHINPNNNNDISGARLQIDCQAPVKGELALGDVIANNRTLGANTKNPLLYNIYLDPAHTMPFGDGTHGTFTAHFEPPYPATITLYGRVFGRQEMNPTTYHASIPVYLKQISNVPPAPLTPAMGKITSNHDMQPLKPAAH